MLDTIMSLDEQYVTEIVTDSATAEEALERRESRPAAMPKPAPAVKKAK
jgi:hypothetical protein